MQRIHTALVICAVSAVMITGLLWPGATGPAQSASDAMPELKREDCIEDCWFTFGSDYSDAGRRMLTRCLRECEQQYWDDFDAQMKDLENTPME
jgi:hypothetical protein